MPSLLGRSSMEESTSQETFTSQKYRLPVTVVVDERHRRIRSQVNKGGGEAAPPTSESFHIKDAVTEYLRSCVSCTASFEMLKRSISTWVKNSGPKKDVNCATAIVAAATITTTSSMMPETSQRKMETLSKPTSTKSYPSQDFASCIYCQCFLADPVTIPCGHTYCKNCIMKVSNKTCLKCGKCLNHLNWSTFKINVIIATLLERWWPNEVISVRLRNEGNHLFQEKKIEKAEEKYSEASKFENTDHLLASNRSCALLNLGKAREALQWAERAIKLRPDWPKGYYRKGAALLSLGQYEDSVVAYLQCLVLNNDLPSVVIEVSKVFSRVISMLTSSKLLSIRGETEEKGSNYCQMSWPLFNSAKRPRRLLMCSETNFSSQNKCSESSDDQSDNEEQNCHKRRMYSFASKHHISFEDNGDSKEYVRLYQFIDRCQLEMDRIKTIEPKKMEHSIDGKLVDKNDFECTLCYRLFWQPVTTPCGHVFCRVCLDRCLDHTPRCPLCKAALDEYLAERRQSVTEFIDAAMRLSVPEDYAAREYSHLEEMNDLANSTASGKLELPIFVCTLGFPTVPCPLHIFEPRYRLMIRRCVESGLRKFGMCPTVEGSSETFADYGTVLEIRDVQYFPDGRALVDTVGCERFRVLRRGMKDGYHTAVVEILHDQRTSNNGSLTEEDDSLHDVVYSEVIQWFDSLSLPVRNRILQHFGRMPDREVDYRHLPSGPAWVWWTLAILPLDPRAQLAVLAMTTLRRRLEALHHTLGYILKQTS